MAASALKRSMADAFPRLAPRADIQGLRAVAVLLVVLDHAGVPFVRGGFVGVDVFFVVSGYLISMLLLREAATTGSVSILSFYARRARRILPAATVVLVAVAVFAALFMPLFSARTTLGDVVWAAFFGANIHFGLQGTDYFQQGLPPSPVQHFWSLAVEEQFYLVWPALLALLLALGRRRRPRAEVAARMLPVVASLVAVGWLASLAWSIFETDRLPTAAYFSTFARAWELATGALLALAAPRIKDLPRVIRHLLALGGLGAILVAAVIFRPTMGFPGWVALLPVLGTAAVLAAGAPGTPVGAARLLTVRPVTWIGDISYSFYLWHWPALVLGAMYLGRSRSPMGTAGLVVTALLVSALSYYFVENPLRRSRGPWLAGRRGIALWPVAVGLTLVTVLGAVRYVDVQFVRLEQPSASFDIASVPAGERVRLNGEPIHDALAISVDESRVGAPIPFPLKNDLANLREDSWQQPAACTAGNLASSHTLCPIGDTQSDRVVVVFGDSHANMWLPGLDDYARREGFQVVPLIKFGCDPYDVPFLTKDGRPDTTCAQFRDWALTQISKLHPAVVVVATRMNSPQFVAAPGQSRTETWREGVTALLGQLTPLTKQVRLLGDVSQLSEEPAVCLSSRGSTMKTCTSPENKANDRFNRVTRETAPDDFVDVMNLVCVSRRCPMVADKIATYRARNHVSRTWSLHVGEEFGSALRLPF